MYTLIVLNKQGNHSKTVLDNFQTFGRFYGYRLN